MFEALLVTHLTFLVLGGILGYQIGEYRGMFPTRKER